MVDLPEPVTLDFLDAEVEDSNKTEVRTQIVIEAAMCPLWDTGSFRAIYMNYTGLSRTLRSGEKWKIATDFNILYLFFLLVSLSKPSTFSS